MAKRIDHTDRKIDDRLQTVSYKADGSGDQRLVPTTFWDPVNIVNGLAWNEIEEQIARSKELIGVGRVSPLHYYMTANQMDARLLARYTGQRTLAVRLHLRPFFFKRLGKQTLRKYSELFNISPEDLLRGKLAPPLYEDHDQKD